MSRSSSFGLRDVSDTADFMKEQETSNLSLPTESSDRLKTWSEEEEYTTSSSYSKDRRTKVIFKSVA